MFIPSRKHETKEVHIFCSVLESSFLSIYYTIPERQRTEAQPF